MVCDDVVVDVAAGRGSVHGDRLRRAVVTCAGDRVLRVCRQRAVFATLVERHTRYAMLPKRRAKDTQTVVTAIINQARKLPKELYKSLTWAGARNFGSSSLYLGDQLADVRADPSRRDFYVPQSPWQRGSNENTNGLLQQYFPKGTDSSRSTRKPI